MIFETTCVPDIRGKATLPWVWTLADRQSVGRRQTQTRSRKEWRRKHQIDISLQSVNSCWGLSPLFLHYQRFLTAVMPPAPLPSSHWVMMRRPKESWVRRFSHNRLCSRWCHVLTVWLQLCFILIQVTECREQQRIPSVCTTPLLPSGCRGRDSRCRQSRRSHSHRWSRVQYFWPGELKSLTGSSENSQPTHNYGSNL